MNEQLERSTSQLTTKERLEKADSIRVEIDRSTKPHTASLYVNGEYVETAFVL